MQAPDSVLVHTSLLRTLSKFVYDWLRMTKRVDIPDIGDQIRKKNIRFRQRISIYTMWSTQLCCRVLPKQFDDATVIVVSDGKKEMLHTNNWNGNKAMCSACYGMWGLDQESGTLEYTR